jgi:hypothetical protein
MFLSCVCYYKLICIVAIKTYILYGSYQTFVVIHVIWYLFLFYSHVERFALFRNYWCDVVHSYFTFYLWIPLCSVLQCPALLEVRLQIMFTYTTEYKTTSYGELCSVSYCMYCTLQHNTYNPHTQANIDKYIRYSTYR